MLQFNGASPSKHRVLSRGAPDSLSVTPTPCWTAPGRCFLFGVVPCHCCAALEGQTRPTFFFNFIFIPPPALMSGAEAERSGPGDALCGAVEGGASVFVASPRSAILIGPERALGVRGHHDEKKRRKNGQTLKLPTNQYLLRMYAVEHRLWRRLGRQSDGRKREKYPERINAEAAGEFKRI